MSLVSMHSGAVTHQSAQIAAQVAASASVRIVYARATMKDRPRYAVRTSSGALAYPSGHMFQPPAGATTKDYSATATADSDGYVKVNLTGLLTGQRYYYRVEENGVLSDTEGQFSTAPAAPGSRGDFVFGASSCAREADSSGASTHRVFNALAAERLLFFIHMGDFIYSDSSSSTVATRQKYLNRSLTALRQAQFYQSTPLVYVWDDHDYAPPGNQDTTNPGKDTAAQVVRQIIASSPLAQASGGIYRAFTIGRVRVIITDIRFYRSVQTDTDDASKTMLGATQKQWFKDQLTAAKADPDVRLIVWVTSQTPTVTDWDSYSTERRELWNHLAASGINDLLILSGDIHVMTYQHGVDYSDSQTAPASVFAGSALDQDSGTDWIGNGWLPGPVAGAMQRNHQYVRCSVSDPLEGPLTVSADFVQVDDEGTKTVAFSTSHSASS